MSVTFSPISNVITKTLTVLQALDEVDEAIQNGSLKDYLEKADPDVLIQQLLNDCKNRRIFKILKVCDEKMAMPLLASLTTEQMLSNYDTAFYAIGALALFSKPDRLPVFIEALKLGRDKDCNTIDVKNLLYRHSLEKGNPFKGGLLEPICNALEIENGHRRSVAKADAQAETEFNKLMLSSTKA